MVEFDRSQVTVYLCISVIYSLIGIPANILSLIFFLKKDNSEHISRSIFILLNSTDLFVCFCFILLSVSYISLLAGGNVMESSTYCSLVLATFPTAQQFSIFITAVFCIVRTVSIMKPILMVSKRVVFAIISLYFGMLIVRNVLLFRDDSLIAAFRANGIRCGWQSKKTGQLADFSKLSFILISLILTPSILGCLLSICWLKRPQQFPVTPTKRKATITVVILTIVCVVASSAFVVERIMRLKKMEVSPLMENIALQFAYSFTCVANPTVYFTRLSRLREFVRGLFRSQVRPPGSRDTETNITTPRS